MNSSFSYLRRFVCTSQGRPLLVGCINPDWEIKRGLVCPGDHQEVLGEPRDAWFGLSLRSWMSEKAPCGLDCC